MSVIKDEKAIDLEAEVIRFKPLVVKVARRILNHRLRWQDDLVSVGLVAVATHRTRYDASRGTSLPTYLASRVQFAMIDWIRDHGPCSRMVTRLIRMQERAEERIAVAGERATPERVCEALTWSPERYELSRSSAPLSIHGSGSINEQGEFASIANLLAAQPTRHGRPSTDGLKRLSASWSVDELVIVYLRFWCDQRQCEIAKLIGLSESRVFQILAAIAERLKRIDPETVRERLEV